MLLDTLRPPSPAEVAGGYKDWLHLNLFEADSSMTGLINVALHGPPHDPRSRVVGTAMFHHPDAGWVGNVETRGPHEAWLGVAGMAVHNVALTVDQFSGRVVASVSFPADELSLQLVAEPRLPGIAVEQHSQFGRGWVAWYAVPRLSVKGHASIAGQSLDLSGASAYYDHNWGRWRWGEDAGWEWGVFVDNHSGPTLVMSRVTNRSHREVITGMLKVHVGDDARTFRGSAIEIDYDGVLRERMRRVPGALAALHQDRMRSNLPSVMHMSAYSGSDWVDVEFRSKSALQLVTAEPLAPGYGFVQEITGEFTCVGKMGAVDLSGTGSAVIEYVD
jgi:hypothetical protein